MSTDHIRTQAICDFPPPKDVNGITRFTGVLNFYHKLIPNLAKVAAPLNALRKKGAEFSWGSEQQKAFSTYEPECLAALFGIEEFHKYLEF
jgi:hypothetical protein